MSNTEIKKSRNEQIAELLSDGEKIKDFYRFAAQNPHIDLHDACQIVLARPKASICFYMDEWNEMGRRVTKNRKGIQFYDTDGNKQYVFDLHDTHGDKRYRRLIFPMRRLLYGLDELNGTEIADSSRRDYSKVLSGVAQYLDENGYFTADEQRNTLLAEGVAYSLYSKTGFPKDGNIALRGMPYELDENARLFKEVYLLTELAKEDISAAYERRINTPQVIDDIEEETVSDEPTHAESSAGMPINAVETGEEEIEFPDGAQEGKEHVTDAEKQVFDETELSELADILAEEYSEQEEEIQPPKLEEITNDEPSPFSGEPQADEERETSQDKFDLESGQEEPDGQDIETEDAEEEWEDPDEEQRDETDGYLPETKDGKREKPGNGIRGRKRKDKPQLSLFDLLDGEKEPSREEQLIERQLLRGSGIEDGKYRIYDKYFTDPTIKEYAKFLKDEYGIGGYGYGQERQDHNGKGIRMEWQDREYPENSIRIDLKWNEVAVHIADLIDEDKYLTAEEKEDYEKRYKPKQAEEQRLREAEQKKKDEFVYRVIQNTNPTRKQHILGEYGKTTKIVEFAEFLRNEYGYSTEATSEYLARYNENGVWLSKYDKSGNTELHVNLSWNDFAEKVCDVIDDDCLFPEDYDEERNKRITDNIIREGTERTNDGNYAFFFGTYGESESYVREHCKEIEDVLRSRNEVKKVSSDDWYIHVTYYKDYCTNLQGTEEARQEHKERVRALAAQIVEEGTENTTEGVWVVYFNELTGDEEFAKTYAQEIAEELGRHESVADVEFDNTCIDTAFYLDYCPNYIPHEDEDGYAEDLETAETEQMPIKSFNRFTELAPEEKTIFDHYVQRTYQEPRFSPWGMVQDCTVIAPGIYSVVTAGHGGMMIDAALAPHILSPEALSEGFTESGYYCYEEDAAESIPLRELYDKGILGKTNEYFTRLEYVSTDPDAEDEYIRFAALTETEKEGKLKQWNDAVNETVAHWYPSYWEAYQQAQGMSENNAENTDLNAVLDQSDLGGAKTRFKNNVAAIRLSKFLHERNAMATDAERKVLAKYVGWGGLAQAFDETNEQWRKEYEELKSLLTPSEYEMAKGSVLNAHYTSREVIGGIYAALERFGVKGNNRILEPALGTGNFFGYMPQEIATGARLHGVELDTVTGMIASKLYPQANVQIKGFEETSFPDDYFDLVVSNVPFGGYGVYDSEYSRQKFLIHDYFIAKSLDKVKPNGIVAVVTSKGTLDKLNPTARKYMAERAELLGAIRLPNTAFKQTANTEAVTDILFFQKREEKISDTSGIEWLGTGKTEDGFEVNNYFIVHPEMVLGTLAKETGLYGAEGITVNPDGRNLGEALAAAVNSLPQNIYRNPEQSLEETVQGLDESVFDIRPMCYIAVNGKLYMRIGEKLEQQELPNFPKDAYERIAGMIALRDELRLVLDIQTRGCTDEELRRAQWKLNADYDRFVRKYGYINSQTNTRLFREDGDAALLFACEVLSEDKTRATKADVFTKRTIRPYSAPTHTNDALEALQICRNERGGVDIAYIEELTGKDYDTVINELGDAVYRDPEMVESEDKYSGYQTAEEYLSGKVVEKLQKAKYYASHNSVYSGNVAALEKVQPEPLKADEIAVRIGASWVKPEYYKQFLMELLDIYWYYEDGLTIRYNPFDNSWKVERADHVRKSAGMYATEKYGTSRANAFRLFEDCLNQRATSIYDTVEEDGREKRVLNQAETIAAREKQNKIKEAFADWIYADPKRREDLEKTYNSLFNQIRLPVYDGSFLKFPGMNPAIELRPHQKNAVARIAGTGNSTLLHHVVGSGKSFTMAASAMKLRQYGLAKKPMIVVPNHLVQQMANEFRTLYPTAKLLIANKEDLEKNKRKQFVSKVAMGDWDSVIIAQSSFAKIPVSRERQERKIRDEIAKIKATIEEMEEKTGTRVAVKNLERIKKGREAMLKKLTDSSKKDDVLIFENLGVDYLFVDEADSYKNLFLYTKMNNVSGISNAASARASDMQMKIEYINELHGGDKGVVFATGTPISNSMAEMYVMQTYLQKNILKELGIDYFDGWAADFGETVTALEMAPSGQGYRARTRFAKFTNLPELMTLYRSFADVQTADMVKLDVPEAERITVTLEPSEQTVQIAEEIAKRAEAIYNGGVDPHLDNMLKVTSDGKKLALDVRCFDSFLKDERSGKLAECADNAVSVYEETNAARGTQLIFCDMSTPKKPYENYEYGEDFDVYNDLKHKLIERGIPAEEIAFIHDAKTDKEKQALFDKMNEGKIRILIGSTEKCGAGTNVQKRLAALHHLDAPYRPRDLQQRDGRGIRQGNTNEEVKIFTYVTKRTLDSYCYQILENKQRFISQIENGSVTAREAEDIDETTLSYAEIKAITAANPKIKRKMELETELTRLRVLEGQYKKNLYALQDKTIKDLPTQIRTQQQLLKYAQEDEEHMRGKYNPDVFSINVLGKVYTDKKEGAAALVEALRSNKYDTPVAEYGGFRISLNPPTAFTETRSVALTHHGSYGMEIGDSELGLITRLDNFMRDFPERKGRYSAKLEQLKRDLAVAEEELKKPFEHKGKIEEITKELSEINAELDLNKREEVVIDTEEETDDEEVNYMALPERGQEKEQTPEKRSHRRMTEKLYALYAEQEAKMPDAVIFLKNGDLYETVGEDANTAAATYGAKTYEKEFGGQNRTVAMLTYDDLDAMVNDLADENRRFKIVEPEKEIGRDTDFLETEEEARAIAENEKEPEIEVEEEDKVYYSVIPEDEKYRLYMIDNACKIYPVGDLYATLDEAREAAQTFGDEPQEWERVEVSLDELQEYASNMGAEAKIQVPILPDYFITQEEMHEYGYLWNGVLPLTKPVMQNNFQNCLRLYEDDSEGYMASEGEMEEHDGLFGIERSDWKRFIESENGKAYLAARLFASTAVMKMVGEEYSETDEREADGHDEFASRIKAENIALSNYFKDKWFPLPDAMQPYVENIINEYAERIFDTYKLEAREKSEENIKSEIIARIGMPEILSEQNSMAAKEELFKENREYLEQHGDVPCYVIEHNEKTGKYRYRTIGGYEILVPSQQAYDDEQSCRAAAPRGVELTDMEELAEISRMRCKIYPDYFVRVSENGQYYPLSKRKAQQLFNLGLPVCRVNSEAEYVSKTEQSALDNTEKGFCIGRPEWYAFTRTDEGKAYLYARLLTVKAAEEVVEKDLDTVGYYADSYAEVFYEVRKDLENFFNGQPVPSDEAVKAYLYGLCREYASMLDGNGKLRYYGWWYEDVIKAIAKNLPEQFSKEVERIAAAETETLKPDKTYYSAIEKDGEWRLCGIDVYDAVVTYIKFQTEEKRDEYIKDMLSANSGLQFEAVQYEKLKEIADDLKIKREEYVSQDREVFLKNRMEEKQINSAETAVLLPDYTIRNDGTLSVEYIKDGMYKVRRETAEVLRGVMPVYNIEPDGIERQIGTDENLIMGSWRLGIKETDWKEFLESDKSTAYLCARFFVADAALLAVRRDANAGDVRKKPFTVGSEAILNEEEGFLYEITESRGIPPTDKMQPYVDGVMAEYMYRIVLGTPYMDENPQWNKHGEAFRWEMVRRLQREGMRENQYKKLMSDMKSIADYLPDGLAFYVPVWDDEEKKYYIYTANGYNELKKGAAGYETIGESRRSLENGIELPHMQALIEMSRYQYHILPEYEISYEHLSQYGFRDIKVCPLTRRRAQQLYNLGMRVYALNKENRKQEINNISEITGGKFYGVDKEEWREFSVSQKGIEYLTARKIAANAALQAWSNKFSKSDERDYGDAVERLIKERDMLDRFLAVQMKPGEDSFVPYVSGLVKEYAAKFGKELPAGMTYTDVEDTISDLLPKKSRYAVEKEFLSERKERRSETKFYTVEEKDGKYEISYVNRYDNLVTSKYKDRAESEYNLEIWREMQKDDESLLREVPMSELQDYYKKRLEKYREMLSSDPQVFKDIPVKETSVRPDYWISDEEMHDYGYTREDMLPLRERSAKYIAEQFSLPVYKLYQNNTAEQTKNAGEIDAFGGIFGVKREDWERFLTSEKARGYFGASLGAVTAAQKALNNDMGNVDARFTGAVSDKLFSQNNEINRYLSHEAQPGTEAMKPYIRQAMQEYAYWLNAKIPFDYGWDAESIEAAMLNYVEPAELKSYLNQSGGAIRYYGKDTENTAYAYVKGELNEHTFKEILEQCRGADSFIIAAESSAFTAEALRSRSVVYLKLGKQIQKSDLADEAGVIARMQTTADKLAAERTRLRVENYERVRDSVLQEYAEFEKKAEDELPYKQRFYKAIADYFAKGGGNLLSDAQIEKLSKDTGNILARLYDYDWDGVSHDLSNGVETTVLIEYYAENTVPEKPKAEDKDYAAIVRKNADVLYEEYKKEHPDYANNLNRNLFYRNMHEYLQYTDTLPYAYFMALEQDDENVMSRLCEFYEQNGDLALHSYRERQEIIEQYAEKYYPEILQETKQPRYYGKGADGTVYYFLPEGLSLNTLADIKEKADEYVIAAPMCMLSEEELEKEYITFVKTGRDIPEWVVYGTAATAKHAMREAAEQARREKEYRSAVADNARLAWGDLRSDSSEAGYKERFFGAFAEFMAESDTFLEEGDYAELVKDGDAITERVYAYYMGMNEQINFEDWEELSRLTKDYIDERWKMQKAMTEGVPLYGGTFEYAKANGEENLYRQSLQANIECKHEIEQAIRNNFDGMHLNKGFENALIEKFGLERMRYVLANTVQENDWDGRYSPETKEWAKSVTVTEKSEHRSQFAIGTHPAVLDGFINRVRKLEKSYKESNEKIFEYGGYHFIPERKFTAEENGFDKISRRLKQDTEMGLCREGYAYESKYPYSHDGFYAASPDKECDLFRCIENGKLYLPCENDLQEYLAELTAEKTTEEKQQEPKEEIYYAFIYEKDTDDRSGYRAYVLEKSSGRLLSVFREPVDQYETILSEMEKFEKNSTNRQYRYIRVEPHELLAMSSKVSQKEEKGEEVQEERYRTETKKGLPVVHIEKDKYGHDIAIVKRKDDFVVAIGYDVKDGTWAQGRYDFPTQDAAQKYIDKNYKPQEEEKGKWLTAKVSRDALIRRYDRHSFFRMPNGEYEEYTYNVFNNRVKDSRQLVDLESDGHELCYELVFPADGEVTIKTRDGDEVIFPAEEFTEIINGTANADYEREKHEDDTVWYAISVPQEALRGTYERASLFFMPSKGEYTGYRYFIPNVFVEEDKRGEEGNILITLPESFQVTLRNRDTDDEIVVTPYDLFSLCNGTKGEDYARIPSETEKKAPLRTVIPAAAKIAEYKAQTLFKMPHTGEYDGYCFYLFNDQLSQGDEGIQAKLSENFTVQLKDKKNDRQTTLTAEQFKAIMDAASAEDFDSGLKKPSEEKEDLFKGAEEQLRKNIPEEMLSRPNWVAVKVFRDKKKDKLVKLPKDAKTGEAASPNDPSTWSDFDTACKFAHENGCAALGFALDGKDNICCIDIDHCFNAKREMSDIAKAAWNACGNTYREVSVSREGLHIFGKTKGMGLQVFSDAGDMEFYERGKFMTVTGDAFGEGRKNLLNLDELPVKDLLSRKFSKHKTYSWAGKGIKGLSSMPDREVLERAFASKDGETFKALFNGEDLKNNHSNSDMALMRRLAFWCNGDIDQMLRIFAASGLYRPDKSPEYYEYSALKVLKDQSSYYHPKQSDSKPQQEKKKTEGNSK